MNRKIIIIIVSWLVGVVVIGTVAGVMIKNRNDKENIKVDETIGEYDLELQDSNETDTTGITENQEVNVTTTKTKSTTKSEAEITANTAKPATKADTQGANYEPVINEFARFLCLRENVQSEEGFESFVNGCKYISKDLMRISTYYPEEFDYSFCDIDKNGIDELIVADGSDGCKFVMSIYTISNGNYIRLVSQEMQRQGIHIYSNGVITDGRDTGNASHETKFYKISANGNSLDLIDVAVEGFETYEVNGEKVDKNKFDEVYNKNTNNESYIKTNYKKINPVSVSEFLANK